MSSRTAITTFVAALALTGCASVGQTLAGDQNQKRHELKDGTVLVVDADGRMRMFNAYGDPLFMKDGVAMERKDGMVIVMKENVIWQQLRTRGTLGPRT